MAEICGECMYELARAPLFTPYDGRVVECLECGRMTKLFPPEDAALLAAADTDDETGEPVHPQAHAALLNRGVDPATWNALVAKVREHLIAGTYDVMMAMDHRVTAPTPRQS